MSVHILHNLGRLLPRPINTGHRGRVVVPVDGASRHRATSADVLRAEQQRASELPNAITTAQPACSPLEQPVPQHLTSRGDPTLDIFASAVMVSSRSCELDYHRNTAGSRWPMRTALPSVTRIARMLTLCGSPLTSARVRYV